LLRSQICTHRMIMQPTFSGTFNNLCCFLEWYTTRSAVTRHLQTRQDTSSGVQVALRKYGVLLFVRVLTMVETTARLSSDVHRSHVKIPCLTQISSSADRWYCSIIHEITAGQGRNREEHRSVQRRGVFFSYFNFKKVLLHRFIFRSESSSFPTLLSA